LHQVRSGDRASNASVALEVELVEGGVKRTYNAVRSWTKRKETVSENIKISKDNLPLGELYPEQYQSFLDELVPLGVAGFFFFDGERIQRLAEEEGPDPVIADSIRGLLGLNLTGRLRADISILMRNRDGSLPASHLRGEYEQTEQRLAEFDDLIIKLKEVVENTSEDVQRLEQGVELLESNIASEGGDFADRREGLLKEQAKWQASLQSLEGELRELANGLLPFALVPHLCVQLRERINQEASLRRRVIENDILKNVDTSIAKALSSTLFWTDDVGFEPPADLRYKLAKAVSALVQGIFTDPCDTPAKPVHDLSDRDTHALLTALGIVLDELPKRVAKVSSIIGQAQQRLHKVEQDLQRVPQDEVLQPLLHELNQFQVRLGEARSKHVAAQGELKSELFQREQQERKLFQLGERVQGLAEHGRKMALAAQVRTALISYEQELSITRVNRLSECVTDCLQILEHKESICSRVTFDPRTFSATLYNDKDRIIPKGQLSAGEKQILAVAILWGLGRASGRQLPVIIDTPLARLDAEHRHRLVTQYFPNASNQVVLLSTDSEVDHAAFAALVPWVARTYHLQFDRDNCSTRVDDGYFPVPEGGN
jgi:DNA sulfur modification protein DndD